MSYQETIAQLSSLTTRRHVVILLAHLPDGRVIQSKPFISVTHPDGDGFSIKAVVGFGGAQTSERKMVFRGNVGDTGVRLLERPLNSGVRAAYLAKPIPPRADEQAILNDVMRAPPNVARIYVEALINHEMEMQAIRESFGMP